MEEFWPTFGYFSEHKGKLMKLKWYLTVFPSHFNNIFFKSFRLLLNLTRNCEILQKLMRFHETNDIKWNFSAIILCFCSVGMHFVDIRLLSVLLKDTAKFQFHSKRFKILKFWTWAMVKVKKVNIAVTYNGNTALGKLSKQCTFILILFLQVYKNQSALPNFIYSASAFVYRTWWRHPFWVNVVKLFPLYSYECL